MIDPRTISRKSIIRIFLTKLPFFLEFLFSFGFFFPLRKVREEFTNFSVEVGRQSPRISKTCCRVYWPRDHFPAKIAKNSYTKRPLLSVFYGLCAHWIFTCTLCILFGFTGTTCEHSSSCSRTARLWSWPCESRFTSSCTPCFLKRKKNDETRSIVKICTSSIYDNDRENFYRRSYDKVIYFDNSLFKTYDNWKW